LKREPKNPSVGENM